MPRQGQKSDGSTPAQHARPEDGPLHENLGTEQEGTDRMALNIGDLSRRQKTRS